MKRKTAMILAAGRGERMRPLTDKVPKPLLKVKGKALIEYHLEALSRAGYRRVVINHAWLGEQIETVLGKGERFGLEILYSAETQALETAGGIKQALPLLCPDDENEFFTVVNGDIFTDFDFTTLPSQLVDKVEAHLVMVDNPSHNPQGDFCFSGGKLHPNHGRKLTCSGIAVYSKHFFEDCTSGVNRLAPMWREAADKETIMAQYFSGQWTDVGTPQRLDELNKTDS
ncbi:N-acetylmuramate alpha-1-phosphate uridylyltransferase MurU [Paraglaciecola arctica]|uniref:N-acetylmuramate alpha-1-phosphate uridylyltransferase MurU n=1 Tax=Paraglaciecola arctica TaxID=1128911 RepID=UPI0020910911|nr:nucleotidyltransferase family protein [Paraglaciecola arctica]